MRIDFSPAAAKTDLKSSIYEIEARPAGMGIMCSVFNQRQPFQELIDDLSHQLNTRIGTKVCPSIAGDSFKKDRRKDTQLFAASIGCNFFDTHEMPTTDEYILWVRGGMEDELYLSPEDLWTLENMALAPVRDHGNKKYLIKMGLAQHIGPNELDYTHAFCVKPLKGSKTHGIGLWDPTNKKAPGISSKKRIERLIRESIQPYITQPFISPELVKLDGHIYDVIYRVFALLNLN